MFMHNSVFITIWVTGVGTSSAGIETLADVVTNQSPLGRFWVYLISGNLGSTMTQFSCIRKSMLMLQRERLLVKQSKCCWRNLEPVH